MVTPSSRELSPEHDLLNPAHSPGISASHLSCSITRTFVSASIHHPAYIGPVNTEHNSRGSHQEGNQGLSIGQPYSCGQGTDCRDINLAEGCGGGRIEKDRKECDDKGPRLSSSKTWQPEVVTRPHQTLTTVINPPTKLKPKFSSHSIPQSLPFNAPVKRHSVVRRGSRSMATADASAPVPTCPTATPFSTSLCHFKEHFPQNGEPALFSDCKRRLLLSCEVS